MFKELHNTFHKQIYLDCSRPPYAQYAQSGHLPLSGVIRSCWGLIFAILFYLLLKAMFFIRDFPILLFHISGWTSRGCWCALPPCEGAYGCLVITFILSLVSKDIIQFVLTLSIDYFFSLQRNGERRSSVRRPHTSSSSMHGKAWFESMNCLNHLFHVTTWEFEYRDHSLFVFKEYREPQNLWSIFTHLYTSVWFHIVLGWKMQPFNLLNLWYTLSEPYYLHVSRRLLLRRCQPWN